MNQPLPSNYAGFLLDISNPFKEQLKIAFDWIAMFIGYFFIIGFCVWFIYMTFYYFLGDKK